MDTSLTPIKWVDESLHSRDRMILTGEELQIPGIRLIAFHKVLNATNPLLPHYHENAFEFTLVVDGMMSFYTEGRDYQISGGEIFVSFPDEVHSTNEIPITLNMQYWIQVDVSDPSHFLFLKKDTAASLIEELHQIKRHVVSTDNKEIRSMLEKAYLLAQKPGNELLTASYLTIFLQLVIAFSKESRYHMTPDIDSAIRYVDSHITEELSLEELARFCGLSTSQFKQKFRHIVGISPRNYINRKKIEYAKTLLQRGISVTDTAMQMGFTSSTYFSTVFKKYTMQTPTGYAAAAGHRSKKDSRLHDHT